MSVETKVGLFFFIGIVILGIVTFYVEDVSTRIKKTYEVKAHFSTANGLKPGNSVQVAGVEVGRVKTIELTDTGVDIVMDIEEGRTIKKDAVATITLGGFLGDKFVDISLGGKDAPPLQPGEELAVNNPPDLNAIVANVVKTIDQVADFTSSIAEGKEFFKSLKDAGPKLDKTLTALQEITEKIRAGEGTIGKLVNDEDIYKKTDEIATSLRTASERLAKIIGDNEEEIREALAAIKESGPQIKEAVASLKAIAQKIEKGEGTIGKLVNDPQVFDDLRAALANVKDLTDKMKKGDSEIAKLMDDKKFFEEIRGSIAALNNVAQKLDKGEGTVGRLINDPTLFEEMKKVVQEGREAVRGAKEQIPIGAFGSVIFGAF
ncbi:MAG: MlaD family protein [Planctomycetota bacterium]